MQAVLAPGRSPARPTARAGRCGHGCLRERDGRLPARQRRRTSRLPRRERDPGGAAPRSRHSAGDGRGVRAGAQPRRAGRRTRQPKRGLGRGRRGAPGARGACSAPLATCASTSSRSRTPQFCAAAEARLSGLVKQRGSGAQARAERVVHSSNRAGVDAESRRRAPPSTKPGVPPVPPSPHPRLPRAHAGDDLPARHAASPPRSPATRSTAGRTTGTCGGSRSRCSKRSPRPGSPTCSTTRPASASCSTPSTRSTASRSCRSSSRSACCRRTTPPWCSASWWAGSAPTCSRATSLGPGSSRLAAFVAGAIFTFAPYHIAHLLGHMQLIALEWLPFFALYLLRAVQTSSAISGHKMRARGRACRRSSSSSSRSATGIMSSTA